MHRAGLVMPVGECHHGRPASGLPAYVLPEALLAGLLYLLWSLGFLRRTCPLAGLLRLPRFPATPVMGAFSQRGQRFAAYCLRRILWL